MSSEGVGGPVLLLLVPVSNTVKVAVKVGCHVFSFHLRHTVFSQHVVSVYRAGCLNMNIKP